MLIGRLLQGFSAGAELGGVGLSGRDRHPGRKGFYTSWQSGSQQVAIMVAAAMAICPQRGTGAERYQRLGPCIPFLFGCLIVPFIFILRRKLERPGVYCLTAIIWRCAVFATLLANWQWLSPG